MKYPEIQVRKLGDHCQVTLLVNNSVVDLGYLGADELLILQNELESGLDDIKHFQNAIDY